jgi:hypothetical protein
MRSQSFIYPCRNLTPAFDESVAENYQKQGALENKYDPENIFRFKHNIATSLA